MGGGYEIVRSECFYAWKEGGEWLNGSPIQVSNTATVEESCIAIGLPYNVEQYKPVANRVLDQLYGKASGLRLQGAAAPEICYVACGRFEARIEAFLGPWDVAAAGLILQEAGCVSSDFSDGGLLEKGTAVLASHGTVHQSLFTIIQ